MHIMMPRGGDLNDINELYASVQYFPLCRSKLDSWIIRTVEECVVLAESLTSCTFFEGECGRVIFIVHSKSD